jgi:hypothetical protein
MIPPITYALPEHKRNTPKIPEIEAGEIEIHRSLPSNRGKLALSYHEAAHALHFKRNGIQTKCLGPAITHDCPTDSYFACYGSVQVKYRDYLRLALEDPDAFLKTLVAGEVAELVLIGKVDPGASESDLMDYLKHARSAKPVAIWEWKQARESYFQELTADLEKQKEIVHEAERFRTEIFSDISESVKTKSVNGARIFQRPYFSGHAKRPGAVTTNTRRKGTPASATPHGRFTDQFRSTRPSPQRTTPMNDELEVPRKRGRPRKHFRPPILSAEQALALQTLQQIAAAEARERKRLRGIARRAEKKVLDSMSIAETIQEFWAESRKLIDPTRLPEWQARQEYVEALLGDIRTVLENRSSDEEFANDVDEEIRADIEEHGVCGATPILLIGKFWQDPTLLAQLTKPPPIDEQLSRKDQLA